MPGSNPNEIVFSGVLLASTNFNEPLGRTHGQNFYDNSETVYHGSANDTALNAHVQRYHAQEDAVDYFTRFYKPNGELRMPLLTVHTTQDPTVAFSQEALYAAVVAKAGQEESGEHKRDNPTGASKFLVQQSVNRYGHCNFKPQEILNAFQGLFGWVNYGIKPAGGDVTIP